MKKLKDSNFLDFLHKFLDLIQKILNLSSLILICIILIFLFDISLNSVGGSDINLKTNILSNPCSHSEYEFNKFAKAKYPDYELNI